jgi:hypothetical protein
MPMRRIEGENEVVGVVIGDDGYSNNVNTIYKI